MSDATQATRERLVSDLKTVFNDAEDLVKLSASDASGKFGEVRERLQAKLAQTRTQLSALEESVVEKTKVAAKATDEYVHEHPWKSIGVAAGVGLLIGVLLARR